MFGSFLDRGNYRRISYLSIACSLLSFAFLGTALFGTSIGGTVSGTYSFGGVRYCRSLYDTGCGWLAGNDGYAELGWSAAATTMQVGLLFNWILSLILLILLVLNIRYASRVLFLWIAAIEIVSIVGGIVGVVGAVLFLRNNVPDAYNYNNYYRTDSTTYHYSFTLLIVSLVIHFLLALFLILLYRKPIAASSSSSSSASLSLSASSSDYSAVDDVDPCASCTLSFFSQGDPMKLLKWIGITEFILFVLCVASLADPSIGSGSHTDYLPGGGASQSRDANVGLFRVCLKVSQSAAGINMGGGGCGAISANYADTLPAAQAFALLFVLCLGFAVIIGGVMYYYPSYRSNALLQGLRLTVYFALLWSLLVIPMIVQMVTDAALSPGAAFFLFIIEFLGQIGAAIMLWKGYDRLGGLVEEAQKASVIINNGVGYSNNNYTNPSVPAAAYNNNSVYSARFLSSPSVPPASPLHCSHCQFTSPPHTRFCGQCGSKFPTVTVCKQCNNQIAPNNRFCGVCGTPAVANNDGSNNNSNNNNTIGAVV